MKDFPFFLILLLVVVVLLAFGNLQKFNREIEALHAAVNASAVPPTTANVKTH